jgi:hypothetical protein
MSARLDTDTVTRAMLAAGQRATKPAHPLATVDERADDHNARPAFRRWTADEEALLRKNFRRRGPAWCAAKLGRSKGAVIGHANARGLTLHLWTQREVTILRAEWGTVGVRVLRRKLGGRTWKSIEFKARRLGLDGPSQGLVSIAEASEITGVNVKRLRRILDEEAVPVRRRVSTFHGKVQGLYHQSVVDPTDASDAVARWIKRQATRLTLAEAVARYGASSYLVRTSLRALAAIRAVPGLLADTWSVAPADVEIALAQHRDRSRCWRVPGHCGGACASPARKGGA